MAGSETGAERSALGKVKGGVGVVSAGLIDTLGDPYFAAAATLSAGQCVLQIVVGVFPGDTGAVAGVVGVEIVVDVYVEAR